MFSLRRITISRSGKGKNIEWVSERERGQQGRRDGVEEKRGKRHIVNHGPVAPMYYILWARRVDLYMLLHCGAQCSIISPSIPSALIEERVRRAGAREGGRLGEKKVGSDDGGVVDPTATILCTTSVFKAGLWEESRQGTRTSLATLSLNILGGHGSLDTGRTAKHEIAPKITIFWAKTHPHLPASSESRATESSSGVGWSVSG